MGAYLLLGQLAQRALAACSITKWLTNHGCDLISSLLEAPTELRLLRLGYLRGKSTSV